jgi:hypothetical protein
MTEPFHISKIDAAQRQLNLAIRLLFAGADPIAVHTLVGAASTLFTDLVEQLTPEKSWDKQAREANNLTALEYFQSMRKAQNFFKHARGDHDSNLEFAPADTESLAFWAAMNSSELVPMSIETQVFQLWYIASHSPLEDTNESPLREAFQLFGDLRGLPRRLRLQTGARTLSNLEQAHVG